MKKSTPGTIAFIAALPLIFVGVVQIFGNAQPMGLWVIMTIAGFGSLGYGLYAMKKYSDSGKDNTKF